MSYLSAKHTIDTESDAPANVPPVSSAPDKDIITAPTSQSEVVEARSSPSKDFAGLIIPDVSSELQDDFQDTATCGYCNVFIKALLAVKYMW